MPVPRAADRPWAGPAQLLVLFAAVSSPLLAGATDAGALVKEGIVLRRKGDDAAALQKFEAAYQMDKSLRALAQMALAELALGRWPAAHDHLTEVLASSGNPWVEKNRATLTDAVRVVGEHVGKLEVLGGFPGAEVRINGLSRGRLPLAGPLAIAAGSVSIEVCAPGYLSIQRTASIRAGQTTRESFDPLARASSEQRSPNPALPPPPRSAASGGGPPQPAPAPPQVMGADAAPDRLVVAIPRQPSAGRRSAKWISGGLALAAFAGGGAAYMLHRQAASDFDRGCRLDPMTGTPLALAGATQTDAGCQDLRQQWSSDYRWAIIGVVAGGALAATGLVLWLTEPSVDETRIAALACTPIISGPADLAVGCQLRF